MQVDIQITDLHKSFGDIHAVNGLTLSVMQGEMLGLIGPDGAGKTTTLRILCGLLEADSGECVIKDRNVRTQLREIRSFIGYMPQRFSLYPDLTVSENLRFFADLFNVSRKEREERLERLLKFSKLGPFSNRRAQALSGGMKQKLALSCTLIHTPDVLFLDEPTTGVDPVSRREFWDILGELKSQGVTILITTPYMDEAAKCDRVAFIHKGRILAVNVPERIPQLFKGEVYEVICEQPVIIAEKLRGHSVIAGVQIFGDRIHVSGRGEKLITDAVRSVLEEQNIRHFSVKKITPGIEDVFVQLMQ